MIKSQLPMLRKIAGGLATGPKGRIGRYRPTFNRISMMIQEIILHPSIKQLSTARIHLININIRFHFPKVLQNGLQKLILTNRKTKVLKILFKLFFWDCLGTGTLVQLLNEQNCVLDLTEDFIIRTTTGLDVRVPAEVQVVLYWRKWCRLLV